MSATTATSGSSANNVSSTLYAQRKAADTCDHILPHIKPSLRILDVGCGPGSITLDLARLVPDGSVLGIDINQASLDLARTAAQNQGIENVEFRLGDAEDMSYLEDGTFDVVHSHQVLIHLSDPVKAMKEMRRLVKPGGFVSTRDMANQIMIPLLPGIVKNLEAVERMYDARGADRFIGRRTHIVAHEAGFEWAKIEKSTQGHESATNRFKFAQAVKNRFRDELIEAGFATSEECDEYAKAWEEWGERDEGRIMGISGSLVCWR